MIDIRSELPGDRREIALLTEAAFAGKAYSDGTEPDIIERLRQSGTLLVSLVGVEDGEVVAHVAFSPIPLADGSLWCCLGPVSVRPDRQRQGYGTAIIREGLNQMRTQGFAGCILEGDPGYYGRFGFRPCPELTQDGKPSPYTQSLSFGSTAPCGEFRWPDAFYGP